MIYNVDSLRKDTVALIRQIDVQITEAEAEAAQLGIAPNKLRDSDNNWVLNSLLLAKAMAYNTLVMLQQPTERGGSRAPGRVR